MTEYYDPSLVTDRDTPFTIDPITREIKCKKLEKKILMQHDHNSERFRFEIPRYMEGRDVGLCNVVQIYYINIDAKTREQRTGIYTVDDLNVYPFFSEILTCSWLISSNVTEFAGPLSFMLRFAQIEGDKVKYAWSTQQFEFITVAETIESAEVFEHEYVDIIQQWKDAVMAEMYNYVDISVKTNVNVAQIDVNKNNIATLANDTAVMKTRMDTFSKLPEGSTAGDAELADIRVGANGEKYDTAGEAVREQTTNLSIANIDVVKPYLDTSKTASGLLSMTVESGKTWQYVYHQLSLPAGRYILLCLEPKLSSVGSLNMGTVYSSANIVANVKEAGVTEFNLDTATICYIRMQVSEASGVDAGTYSVRYSILPNTALIPKEITGIKDVEASIDAQYIRKQLGKNLLDQSRCTDGYFVNFEDGDLRQNYAEYDWYYVSDYIEIEGGETYAYNEFSLGGAGLAFYDTNKKFICGYAGIGYKHKDDSAVNKNISISTVGGIYKAPSNAVYIRVSGEYETRATAQLEKGSAHTEYERYTEYYPELRNEKAIAKLSQRMSTSGLPVLMAKADSLVTGGSLDIPVAHHSKHNNAISFHGRINTLGTLAVGRGDKNPYCSGRVLVDETKVYVYEYTTDYSLIDSYEHGLTIANFIDISIKVSDDGSADLVVTTTGKSFVKNIEWNGSNGAVYAVANAGSYSDCELKYYCSEENKPIWAFGDSYFDFWPTIVKGYGYKNWMVDGYSGRASDAALTALKEHLKNRIPKCIIWCMGMNNADSGSVNNSWRSVVESVIDICTENNIELILTTIPSTPERDNSYKNEYVRNSGYRYVDIDKAVGADIDVNWYDGLLSGDKVHPTRGAGDIAIAGRMIADVPELME